MAIANQSTASPKQPSTQIHGSKNDALLDVSGNAHPLCNGKV